MSRTDASVMNAMMRIAPPHLGHSSGNTGSAVAVPAQQSVDQFQRGHDQMVTPARTGVGALVGQALGIEFA